MADSPAGSPVETPADSPIDSPMDSSAESLAESLACQLTALHEENETLHAALGCSSSAEIIMMVTELRSSIRALVEDSRRQVMHEAAILDSHERLLASS